MALCPNCNKEISENAHFCHECGATLNTAGNTTNTLSSVNNTLRANPQLNKKLIALAVVLILISFAVEFTAGFTGAMKNNSSKSSFSQSTLLKDKTSNPNIISGATLKSYAVENSSYLIQITGVVSVQVDYFEKGVFVKAKFYDSDGNIIDEKMDLSSALSKGDSWKFSIYAPNDAVSYEITTVGMLT